MTIRQRGILITAAASTLGDSYCSLAWGRRLATEASEAVAASVLRGDDHHLDSHEAALAAWARQVARDIELGQAVPASVRDAVDRGRPVASTTS